MLRIKQRYVGDYTIRAQVFGTGEDPVTVTDPVAVIVAGTEVISTGTPTLQDGYLVHLVPNADLPLGTYEARFSGTIAGQPFEDRQPFEIVGGHVVSLAELKAYDGGAFADESDDRLRDARLWAEQRIEHVRAAGVAFVPRGASETLWADGERELWMEYPRLRTVRSLTVAGVEVDPATVEVRNMSIRREDGFTGKVEVVYEHGYDHPSQPVKEVALLAAKEYLVRNLGSRATTESTDVGFYRLSIAGREGRTGIPEVDAVIADEYRRARGRSVGVA